MSTLKEVQEIMARTGRFSYAHRVTPIYHCIDDSCNNEATSMVFIAPNDSEEDRAVYGDKPSHCLTHALEQAHKFNYPDGKS